MPAESSEERVRRVVVADDDLEMRAVMSSALRRDGFDVAEANDGIELLDMICGSGARSPDLIVSDIQMPRCSGLDALVALRRMRCSIPVVLITAFGDEDTHARALDFGASAIIDKPFDIYWFRRLAAGLAARATPADPRPLGQEAPWAVRGGSPR